MYNYTLTNVPIILEIGWEIMVRQVIITIIANVINFKTALARVLDELERNQKKNIVLDVPHFGSLV